MDSTLSSPLRPVVARVAALNLGYFGIEIAVALTIGSVALIADSLDFLEDAAINLLIFAGLSWSAANRARLGTLMAGILLVPALATAYAAYEKFSDPSAPAALPLTLTGLGALAVNLACALMLSRHRDGAGSLTRAAWLSARNDAYANLAIIAAGLATALQPSPWPDLIAAAGIAILNADSAGDIFRAAAAERRAAREAGRAASEVRTSPVRIFPISDLHLERRRLDLIAPPSADFDVMVCAGDLYEGHPERGLAALLSLAGGRPVVLVPGNHEHYAPTGDERTAPELLAALADEVARLNGGGARIHLLRHGASCVLDGVRFVGATLWSDWSLAGRWLHADTPDRPADPVAHAAARMTDPVTGSREYRGAIRKDDGTSWLPADAMAAHASERTMLLAALAKPFAGPTAAVTHHPPSPRAADAFRDAPGVPWWVPAFYATTVLDDLDDASRPDLWVSGHFHAGHDLAVGRCRWVANPVEGATYAADRIVTLGCGTG